MHQGKIKNQRIKKTKTHTEKKQQNNCNSKQTKIKTSKDSGFPSHNNHSNDSKTFPVYKESKKRLQISNQKKNGKNENCKKGRENTAMLFYILGRFSP